MPHTVTWDGTYEAVPADTDPANTLGDVIRDLKRDIRERDEVDHDWDDPINAGYHKKATLQEQAGDPSIVANCGIVYTKDVAGVTELFYKDSAGVVLQLTSGGTVALASGIVLNNAAKLRGKDVGGAAEDLIGMSAADVVELGDPGHEANLNVATAAGLTMKIAGGAAKKVWHEENDGTGSGLDADKLDGIEGGAISKKAGDFSFTVASLVTSSGSAAHGLAIPVDCSWYIEKIAGGTEAGWIVGDRLYETGLDTNCIQVGADGTNVYWSHNGALTVQAKTGALATAVTLSNWRLVVRVWS